MYLYQSIDIGINKSINTGTREKKENLMVKGEGIVNVAAKGPPQKLMADKLSGSDSEECLDKIGV